MTPEIGLADLVRAVAQLAPGGSQPGRPRQQPGGADSAEAPRGSNPAEPWRGDDPVAIARILGLAPALAAAPLALRPVVTAPPTAPRTTGAARDPSAASPSTAPASPAVTSPPGHAARTIERGPVSLRPLGRPERPPPAWLPQPGQGLDPTVQPTVQSTERPAPAELETLFAPGRHRALLSAAVSTLDADGALDLERLIEDLARGRLADRLPRVPTASLHRGAWLLLDRSPAMAPFFDDVTDLAARIARVVGRDATRVQQFTARPDRIWDAARFEDRAFERPPPGTPLVAITDLGRRAGTRGWRELVHRLTARGSRTVAIVPYPAARAPVVLRGLRVVSWDRATNVRAVRPHRRSPR